MKATTHTQKARVSLVNTRLQLTRKLGISMLEYNRQQLDVGEAFLKVLYPSKTEVDKLLELINVPCINYSEQYEHYVKQKTFWQWWRMEWTVAEKHILSQIKQGAWIDKKWWYKLTNDLAENDLVHESYYTNYLKNFGNETTIH